MIFVSLSIYTNMLITSKLPNVGTTIFSVMSQMAHKYNAVNLSQGFPDFDCDPFLVEQTHKYMQLGLNQYAHTNGLPLLRQKIAEKIAITHQINIDPETEITVTAGGTQALFTAIAALVHPNDEVIVFDPSYDSYVPAIELQGAIPVRLRLEAPLFEIPWDKLQRAITPKTKLIIVNSPHNPAASIWAENDWNTLAKITENTNIIVLSDEVYEHLVYDKQRHFSVLQHQDLRNCSLAVYSFGKTLHATGWKVGYCVANPVLMNEFRKVHQFLVFSVNTPLQYAIADHIAESDNYLLLNNFFEQKRNLFVQLLEGSRFELLPTRGSYFQLANYKNIQPNMLDRDFAQWLTQYHGVASIPISVFYHDGFCQQIVRFCFAKKDETLQKAAELLNKV